MTSADASPGPDSPARQEIEALLELFGKGRFADAAALAQQLTVRFPLHGFGWKALGAILGQMGRHEDAIAPMQRSAELSPADFDAHCNLARTLQRVGRLEAAAAAYRRALEIDAKQAVVQVSLGTVLHDLGRLDEAERCYRDALRTEPGDAATHVSLGNLLHATGRLADAETAYRAALSAKPDFALAHNNLANTLRDLGRLDDAEASYRQALRIAPGFGEAHSNFANTLKDLGRVDEAEAEHGRAMQIMPGSAPAYANLLYLHAFSRRIPPARERELAAAWEQLALTADERAAAAARRLAFGNSAPPSQSARKLRIGVVSAELGQHAVAEFLEPVLAHIDRGRFHVALYPTTSRPEERAQRFRELADGYCPLAGIADAQAADLVRQDAIDVLVDTTGYMGGCRLGLFAHRAAPVQCHYIGYHGSTGLSEMDWFIGDEALIPVACDAHFRERIWRLPRLWVSYLGDRTLPPSAWRPSPDGSVWLGSFNNLAKVREESLALWARAMHAIPRSKLLLKSNQALAASLQARIRTALEKLGIGSERVEFAGSIDNWRAHMALYDRLDVALDTIPLNSGTTAFDALWMGVPLVAMEGDWMGARMSNAVLRALGRAEWIAKDADHFAAIAAALAEDVAGRKAMRATQRDAMAASPLCDAAGMAKALESAFEQMYELWWNRKVGGADGTRTRDPRRDRPVF